MKQNGMTLYHGSSAIVRQPVYGKGRKGNDFGQGFYLTQDPALAAEWASQDRNGGFVNTYAFDSADLTKLDLTDGKHSVLEWLAMLLENRNLRIGSPIEERGKAYLVSHFHIDIPADIIKGYRADDSYFSFARAFLGNSITLQQLNAAMRLGDLGTQYVLKTRKAFERVRFVGAEPVDGTVFYPKRRKRDQMAREAYRKMLESAEDGLFLMDLIREEVTRNDPRIF